MEKTQCRLTFGDNIVIARNASSRPGGKIGVDHIAYTLANWDTDKAVKPAVEAELKRRGLMIRTTEGSSTSRIRTALKCRWAANRSSSGGLAWRPHPRVLSPSRPENLATYGYFGARPVSFRNV